MSSVRRLEGGRLHPEVGADGVRRFDPGEVEAVAAARGAPAAGPAAGALAAVLFAEFDAGKNLREIVREHRLPPRVVREHYAEWIMPLADGEKARRRREAAAREERELAEIERERDREARAFEKMLADSVRPDPP